MQQLGTYLFQEILKITELNLAHMGILLEYGVDKLII